MKSFPARTLLAVGAALAVLGLGPAGPAHARIEALSLEEMLARCDNAIFGEIVARHVTFVPEPDGPGLYFTTLTLEGYGLVDRVPIRVDVTHGGGFLDEERGVFNSEAPSADDTRVGTRVVAFYKWVENMGGGLSGNVLYAGHGGLFRTVEGPLGTMALGRGESFAVRSNMRLDQLHTAALTLAEER